MTKTTSCALLGAPIGKGAGVPGCERGPAALRAAGIATRLRSQGWDVTDLGDATPRPFAVAGHANPALRNLGEVSGWIAGLGVAATAAGAGHDVPVFLGGDHTLSAATVPAMAARAARRGRPLFVLWLDAHPDLHTLDTTASGNLHGVPVAYFTGAPGFESLPTPPATVPPENVCMMGLRSVDAAERALLERLPIDAHRMADLRATGLKNPLRSFLARVARAGGDLHLSLDVDFLDPAIAPAVGTAVPNGATEGEVRWIMRALRDSGLVTSLDLVELNPTLDATGETATLLTSLAADLLDRPSEIERTGT